MILLLKVPHPFDHIVFVIIIPTIRGKDSKDVTTKALGIKLLRKIQMLLPISPSEYSSKTL